MKRSVAVVMALASVTTTAHAQEPKLTKQMQRVLAMSPEQFAQCASISDDSLDTVATISTEPCFKETRGLLKIVWNDNFLRIHVNKKTGLATFQVYQLINYSGSWRFYETVNYETPDGPVSEPVTVIGRDVLGCGGSSYGSSCTLSEHFAFTVDEKLLRQIAEKWQPKLIAAWRFKFGAKAAQDWQDGLPAAEVAGAMLALDRYKQQHQSRP